MQYSGVAWTTEKTDKEGIRQKGKITISFVDFSPNFVNINAHIWTREGKGTAQAA